MLKYLLDNAQKHAKPITICGEIASDTHILPLLIGLGFRHISIDMQSAERVYKFLNNIDLAFCQRLAKRCLHCTSSREVNEIMVEMGSYLAGQLVKTPGADSMESVDPVCKMIVHTKENHLFVKRNSRIYYFCSKLCRDRFIQEHESV